MLPSSMTWIFFASGSSIFSARCPSLLGAILLKNTGFREEQIETLGCSKSQLEVPRIRLQY